MGIFSYESARRIGDQNVLRKGDVSMDWSAISVLFKCLLIGQWHNLSDPKLEQSQQSCSERQAS